MRLVGPWWAWIVAQRRWKVRKLVWWRAEGVGLRVQIAVWTVLGGWKWVYGGVTL